MPKSPLFRALQKAFRLARLSEKPGMPPADEIAGWLEQQRQQPDGWTRRRFIRRALQTGAILSASQMLPGCLPNPNSKREKPNLPNTGGPRIAIVGAGIAGLHAGYLLKKGGLSGHSLQIFEAGYRPGGRIMTTKLFGNNMTTEFGGEFLDSAHLDMLNLARSLEIPILDKRSDTCIGDAFFFDGKHHALKDVVNAFRKCSKKIAADYNSLGENYDTPDCIRLDQMNLGAYIDSLPADKWFKTMLKAAYTGEFGLEPEEQSAVNLVDMMGEQKSGFELFGDSDERFKLQGGNQQICDRLAASLGEHLQYGHFLTAVKNKGDAFVLSFAGGGSTKEVEADFVIMTIPFTLLRDVEGLENLTGITTEKLKCIRELGYGTNGKIFLGLNKRPWRNMKPCYQGYLYSETVQTGWDSYHMQNDNQGPSAYTLFLGGKAGLNAAPDKAAEYLPVLDKAFPGFNAACNPSDRAAMAWTGNPMSKGSYATYKPGQWTSIMGREIEPIGNMFFAGDHCSSDFQGYMNGAAETGRLAAEQILAKVGAR